MVFPNLTWHGVIPLSSFIPLSSLPSPSLRPFLIPLRLPPPSLSHHCFCSDINHSPPTLGQVLIESLLSPASKNCSLCCSQINFAKIHSVFSFPLLAVSSDPGTATKQKPWEALFSPLKSHLLHTSLTLCSKGLDSQWQLSVTNTLRSIVWNSQKYPGRQYDMCISGNIQKCSVTCTKSHTWLSVREEQL